MELDRNPYYWGNSDGLTPHVDRVVYRIFGNADAEAAALQSGAIDFGNFTTPSILNTLKNRGIDVRGASVPSFGEIGINNGSAYQTDTTGGFKKHGDGAYALTDVVVRQAIRMAVDSKTLVDKVLLGYGTPGISPVQPNATTGRMDARPRRSGPVLQHRQREHLARQRGLQDGTRRHPDRPEDQQAAGVPVLQPEHGPAIAGHRALRAGLAEADRHQDRPPDDEDAPSWAT